MATDEVRRSVSGRGRRSADDGGDLPTTPGLGEPDVGLGVDEALLAAVRVSARR